MGQIQVELPLYDVERQFLVIEISTQTLEYMAIIVFLYG